MTIPKPKNSIKKEKIETPAQEKCAGFFIVFLKIIAE